MQQHTQKEVTTKTDQYLVILSAKNIGFQRQNGQALASPTNYFFHSKT